MPEVHLIPADSFNRLSNLIENLENNTQSLIDNTINMSASGKDEEICLQSNIDRLVVMLSDVQKIKEELRKTGMHLTSNIKIPNALLYAGTQVFNEVKDKVVSQSATLIKTK